jgi:hypothetical protein
MHRRSFVGITAAGLAGGVLGSPASSGSLAGDAPSEIDEWDPEKPQIATGKKLVVQPLLRHEIETRKPQRSWRNWGGVHTEETVAEEVKRISRELEQLAADAEFPLEILPVATAKTDEEGAKVRDSSPADAMILYAAGATWLDPCISGKRHNIIFVRHRSGPIYDWYENVSNRFLRKAGKDFEYDQFRNYEGVGVDDIVVDDYQEILWRLRAVYGVKNFLGSRAVTIGRASGKGCPRAPELCRNKYKMDIVETPYADLERRIAARRADSAVVDKARQWTETYLSQPNVTLQTPRRFVLNCFLLYTVFKDIIREHDAQSFTIQGCMRTVMPIAETTACLSLSLLQDEGYIAFCESDFASHPAGVLLRYVSGKPVFMHNPTFPHKGIVTCAHCACPRRMHGADYDPIAIPTHYESDFGAAAKVIMPVGQEVTVINPDCSQVRWLGFKGNVIDNPSFSICRSQQDIRIRGDSKQLAREMRGSHWMMAYGDYLNEMGYCMRKLGLDWLNISDG